MLLRLFEVGLLNSSASSANQAILHLPNSYRDLTNETKITYCHGFENVQVI